MLVSYRLFGIAFLGLSLSLGCGPIFEIPDPESEEDQWEEVEYQEEKPCDLTAEQQSGPLKHPERYVELTYLPSNSPEGPYQIDNVVSNNYKGSGCNYQMVVTYRGSHTMWLTFGSRPSQVFNTWKVADFKTFGFSPPTSDSVTISLDNGYSVGETGTLETLSKGMTESGGYAIDVLAEDVELWIDGYGTPQFSISFSLVNYDD